MTKLYLAVAIICEVAATSALKASDGFTKPLPSLATVVGYGISFYLLAFALREIPTGVAYAIWSGVGIVLVTAIAWAFQGQRLDPAALCGLGLIVSGVIVINVFSETAVH